MSEKMTIKERFYWIVAFILHGGGIGDVNIAKVPIWVMYPWMLAVMIWYHLPVVIMRKTYDEFKSERESNEYYQKWLNQERDKAKISDSVIQEIELELRKRGELSLLRDIQKKVNDPEWDFPKYRYTSEESKKPSSIMSTPALNGQFRRHNENDFE